MNTGNAVHENLYIDENHKFERHNIISMYRYF